MQEEMQNEVANLVRLLAEGKFDQVESLTHGVRLPAEQIKAAVEGYGRVLLPLPQEAFELMDVIKVQGEEPERWSIIIPLWSEEEGRSDLSIELTLIRNAPGFTIELDDIHVL